MIIGWSVSQLCFYLISYYMKYIPGSIYTNVLVSQTAEIIAALTIAFLSSFLSPKANLFFSFLISAIGGLLLSLSGMGNTNQLVTSSLILVTKAAIAISSNITYVATTIYFPIRYSSTVFGICIFVSRFFTISSSIIAEMRGLYPLVIFTALTLLSALTSLLLKQKTT